MTNDERPIEVGDRFEDLDPRSEGRIVEVREIGSRDGKMRARVQVEVHPSNPSAIGRLTWLQTRSLRTRYRRLSH